MVLLSWLRLRAAAAVIHDLNNKLFRITSNSDATLTYELDGKKIILLNTSVPPVYRGQGVASNLAKHAFKYATENNLAVVIKCSYLANYYKKHQEKYKGLNVKIDTD